ncbi:hypothetical protein DH2020_048336 [Rehmannia glutinosa]|uniref:No apical meristem-associated C-terminal domain-containing protein n=1 Tax=Rehmannia glutinosa TaxID=99300 RepID=A0ABR0U6M2_REHGL
MASNSRSASYTREEDLHLCHIYLDASQNPIIGINQSKDRFWSRVEESYNTFKPYATMLERNKRPMQCRMQVVMHAIGYGKFTTTNGGNSSQSDTQPLESPGLSSFSLNLSDDNVDVFASQRPIGVKKAKLKRKKDDSVLTVADAIRDETQQLVGLLSNKSTDRQQNYDIERKRLDLLEQQEENKFLLKDLDSISDPKYESISEMNR